MELVKDSPVVGVRPAVGVIDLGLVCTDQINAYVRDVVDTMAVNGMAWASGQRAPTRTDLVFLPADDTDPDRRVLIAVGISTVKAAGTVTVVAPHVEHLRGFVNIVRAAADVLTCDDLELRPRYEVWAAAFDSPPAAALSVAGGQGGSHVHR